jgi:hypothetical protein
VKWAQWLYAHNIAHLKAISSHGLWFTQHHAFTVEEFLKTMCQCLKLHLYFVVTLKLIVMAITTELSCGFRSPMKQALV